MRMSSEICTFVKCMVCMFSGLNTPKLQTSGLTRKYRPFFMTYQTHFLRQYPKSRQSGKSRIVFLYRIRSHRQATVRACCLSGPNMPFGALGMKSLAVRARTLALTCHPALQWHPAFLVWRKIPGIFFSASKSFSGRPTPRIVSTDGW